MLISVEGDSQQWDSITLQKIVLHLISGLNLFQLTTTFEAAFLKVVLPVVLYDCYTVRQVNHKVAFVSRQRTFVA